LDLLNSELSEVEERLEDDDAEVDTDGFRRRSRAAVMTIGAEVSMLAGFIPPDGTTSVDDGTMGEYDRVNGSKECERERECGRGNI
jgi:hypothetical protein